jgi:hypothetical protein
LVADAGGARSQHVSAADLVWRESQLLQERQRSAQPGFEIGGPPVGYRSFHFLEVSQRSHRDRGVADGSKPAMVQAGDECGKDLNLSHRPFTRAAQAFLNAACQVAAAAVALVGEGQDGARNPPAEHASQSETHPLPQVDRLLK